MEGGRPRAYSRVGTGRSPVRPVGHLVPARRRPLHGLYRDRHSGGHLCDRRLRLLRRPLHDYHLSFSLSDDAKAVVGLAQTRLHHRERFRAWPLWRPLAGACRRADRHPRHHALYRAPARGPREGDRRAGLSERGLSAARADHDRVHHSRALHLQERAARPGDDRLRQGRDDLYLRHRGGRHHPLAARRLRHDFRRRPIGLRREARRKVGWRGGRHPDAATDCPLHHARHWIGDGACSCIPTR